MDSLGFSRLLHWTSFCLFSLPLLLRKRERMASFSRQTTKPVLLVISIPFTLLLLLFVFKSTLNRLYVERVKTRASWWITAVVGGKNERNVDGIHIPSKFMFFSFTVFEWPQNFTVERFVLQRSGVLTPWSLAKPALESVLTLLCRYFAA